MSIGVVVDLDRNAQNTINMIHLAAHGRLQSGIEKGTKLAAQYVLAQIILKIENRSYLTLAHSTLVLRAFDGYGNIPLKRTGALVRSIAREITAYNSAEVGLLFRRAKSGKKGPDSFANIGKALHDGTTIKITDAMRRAFARRMGAIEAATGTRFRRPAGGGSGKGFIRIPGRPFIKDVFEDKDVVARIEQIYLEAIEKEVKQIA